MPAIRAFEAALEIDPSCAMCEWGSRSVATPLGHESAVYKTYLPMRASAEAALRAIAEPRRRAILRLVVDDEMTVGAIASEFDVTREAISQHLRVLRQAGLVAERKEGTRRFYRVRPEGLAEVQPFLEAMWDESLALLKAAAERQGRRKRRGR